ncbi:MAG: hypothetical protein H6686_04010 [Fibrobacteria bacterium]|nr:hypothetical protein [Fibrobacteria bacterium]
MNTLSGTLGTIHGDGRVRVAEVETPAGLLRALVLDVASPDRPFRTGMRVRAMFKETAVVVLADRNSSLVGRVVDASRNDVLSALEVILDDGTLVHVQLPTSGLPSPYRPGDEVSLHIPAGVVALEML